MLSLNSLLKKGGGAGIREEEGNMRGRVLCNNKHTVSKINMSTRRLKIVRGATLHPPTFASFSPPGYKRKTILLAR